MRTNINLASHKEKKKKSLGKFNLGAIFVFGGVFAIAAILLTIILGLSVQSNNLTDQSNKLTASIQQVSTAKLNVLLLQERLSSIKQVLTDRTDLNVKLDSLLTLLPSNIGIDTIQSDPDHISLRLVSQNLADLNTLIEDKLGQFITHQELHISKISLTSFGIDLKANTYFAVLDFKFGDTIAH